MNWIWSKVGKVFGSLFLVGGGTVSTGLLLGIEASHAAGGVLVLLSMLLVFLGLAPTSMGAWLLYTSIKADRQVMRDRFFQLLQTQRGRLSVLDFAAATRLEPAIARHHLDAWAKEFSANFEVTEDGDIYYVFAAPRSSSAAAAALLP
ncbi:hypothetical protein [Leptolyngbya sp. FACHB-36]|uniref:hypothetical protein n=1 Tax=Leptolyngbya sp. FACHB-36 TaxID=2692808 RepID=UPI00168104D0|nr:hypothetical protein [Leptolyngbya sp. FACHB-36]